MCFSEIDFIMERNKQNLKAGFKGKRQIVEKRKGKKRRDGEFCKICNKN